MKSFRGLPVGGHNLFLVRMVQGPVTGQIESLMSKQLRRGRVSRQNVRELEEQSIFGFQDLVDGMAGSELVSQARARDKESYMSSEVRGAIKRIYARKWCDRTCALERSLMLVWLIVQNGLHLEAKKLILKLSQHFRCQRV